MTSRQETSPESMDYGVLWRTNWGITSWSAAADGYGAKSGTIDHNETSTLEATVRHCRRYVLLRLHGFIRREI